MAFNDKSGNVRFRKKSSLSHRTRIVIKQTNKKLQNT